MEHVRVGTGAERRMVEERMDRDDNVGSVTLEEAAQAFAIERFEEADDVTKPPTTVRGVKERAVDRGSETKGRTIRGPQLREWKTTMCCDVFDAMFERERLAVRAGIDFIETGDDGFGRTAVAATRIGDQ
ncbi:MAG: hypothetical protein NVS3B28_30420 [Candidatus Velthaea sp.]